MCDFGVKYDPRPEFEFWDQFSMYQIVKVHQTNKEISRTHPDRVLDYQIVDSIYFPEQYLNQRQRVLLTNCMLSPSVYDERVFEIMLPSFYGLYAGRSRVQDQAVDRDFNCLINRMDTNRQSWFYLLLRKGLLDRGYVSFNMEVSRHPDLSDGSRPTSMGVFELQYETHHRGVFDHEHDLARSLVPYKNFDCDIETAVMRSKVSLVLETTFWTQHSTGVTEKIMRCLRLPRPWVVFGVAGTVDYLRTLGLDVLDDIIDHSYDIEPDWIVRQQKVLDCLVKACDTLDIMSIRTRLQKACQHNLSMLDAWAETHIEDFDKSLERAYRKVLAL